MHDPLMHDDADLENFLSAYFHQDWQAEHESSDAVVAYFTASESGAQIDAVRTQLSALLARDEDEAALGATVRRLGGEYAPDADGLTYRAWLQHVLRGLGDPTLTADR